MSPSGPTPVTNDFGLQVRLDRRAREALALAAGGSSQCEFDRADCEFDAPPRDDGLLLAAADWATRARAGQCIQVTLRRDHPLLADSYGAAGIAHVLATPVAGDCFPAFRLAREPKVAAPPGSPFRNSVPPGSADTILLAHVLEELDDEPATALLEACWVALAPSGKLVVVGVTEGRGRRPGRARRDRCTRTARNHANALRRQGFTIVSQETSAETGTLCELTVGIRLGNVGDAGFPRE